jgi:hypothetical protein
LPFRFSFCPAARRLAFCGSSYWTGLRVLGESPFALLGGGAEY